MNRPLFLTKNSFMKLQSHNKTVLVEIGNKIHDLELKSIDRLSLKNNLLWMKEFFDSAGHKDAASEMGNAAGMTDLFGQKRSQEDNLKDKDVLQIIKEKVSKHISLLGL